MEPLTSAAMMGITMTLWVLVYTAAGATVIALFAMLFLGFVGDLRAMAPAEADLSRYMYRWPMGISRGWIAFFAILFMITEALGAAFMLWVGDISATTTGSNIWIAFISLALILPFLIMLAGLVFVAARAFTWHAVLVFFIMATAITIFVLGQVYVWVYNNTLYSQLGAWFTIGLVLITPVWFYWAYVFARDNNEMATPAGLAERYAATFHPEEMKIHTLANDLREKAYATSRRAWDQGKNLPGQNPVHNYVASGHAEYMNDTNKHEELRAIVRAGFQSLGDVPLVRSPYQGVSVF